MTHWPITFFLVGNVTSLVPDRQAHARTASRFLTLQGQRSRATTGAGPAPRQRGGYHASAPSQQSLTFGIFSSGCEQEVLDLLNFARLHTKEVENELTADFFWRQSSPPGPGDPLESAPALVPGPRASPGRSRAGVVLTMALRAEGARRYLRGRQTSASTGTSGDLRFPSSLPPPKYRSHRTPSSYPTRSTQPGGPQIPPGRGLPRIKPLFPAPRPRDTHGKRQEARRTKKNETSVSGQLNPPPERTGYGVRTGSRVM